MGKTFKQSKRQHKNVVLLIILIAAALVIAFTALWKAQEYYDRRLFEKTEKEQIMIAESLAESIGEHLVFSIEARNSCFNTEQGPYDNGRLWCQSASVIKLKRDMDFGQLGERTLEIADKQGLNSQSSNNYGVTRFSFKTSTDVSCRFTSISTSQKEISGAVQKTLTNQDAPAVSMSCAKRAKAKHYKYAD